MTKSSLIDADLGLFVFGNRTNSNILFTLIDLDRLVIKQSAELDNRPFDTRTIGVSLGSIIKQFDSICRDQIDYQDIDRQVSWCLNSLTT